MEFNSYDDDTYEFPWIIDEVRIETDGRCGLLIKDRQLIH